MLRTHARALDTLSAEQGWNSESIITVLLGYIETHAEPGEFEAYLREVQQAENAQ